MSSQFRAVKFEQSTWLKVSVEELNHILKETSKAFYTLPYVRIESEADKVKEAYRNFAHVSTGHLHLENVVHNGLARGPDQEITSRDSCTEKSPTEITERSAPASPGAAQKQQAAGTRTPATARKANSERVLRLDGGGQLDLDQLPTSDEDCTVEMLAACKRRIRELEEHKRKLEDPRWRRRARPQICSHGSTPSRTKRKS